MNKKQQQLFCFCDEVNLHQVAPKVTNCKNSQEQSFIAHIPLLMAVGAFRLGQKMPQFTQWCYLQCLWTKPFDSVWWVNSN